jgi:hypothetical protein
MNTKLSIKPLAIALACAFCWPHAYAEVVNEAWVVRSGDGLYNIARKLAPKDLQMQARIRNEIVQLNPEVNTNSLEIGTQLKLPAFLFKQIEQPPVKSIEPPAPVQISQPKPVVTPDPTEVIGRVVIQSGDMMAVNRGSSRKLNRTSNILKGDTLKTANNSRSQIRLKDGALIAISPDTEIKFEDFAYNGHEDGSERSIINLVRGGFRTITGAIGHTNKQNYQVRTSVATIGIRGTHYGLMLCEAGSCQNNPEAGNLEDGLYGGVVDGSIVTENTSGVSTFNNDQFFHIQTAQTPPVETLLPPPVFQDTPPQTGDHPPQDMANGPGPQGPDAKNPMQGPPPDGFNGQPDGLGPKDGMMLADNFNFDHNPIMPGFFNNDFLPPKDFQLLPGTQPGDNTNTALPQPAPSGSGISIAFTNSLATLITDRTIAVPIYVFAGNPNGIFLEDITDSSGNVIKNLPFAIHEEHDMIDANGNIIGRQIHDAVRNNPSNTGAVYDLASLGGDSTFGVNWGRWNGNYVLIENGAPLPHDSVFHFIYSDNLTPKDTLMNLGGLGATVNYTIANAGVSYDASMNGATATSVNVSMTTDFVNQQITAYSVNVNGAISGVLQQSNPVAFTQLSQGFPLVDIAACTGCIPRGTAAVQFVGPQAEAATTSFSLTDGTNLATGVALLTR